MTPNFDNKCWMKTGYEWQKKEQQGSTEFNAKKLTEMKYFSCFSSSSKKLHANNPPSAIEYVYKSELFSHSSIFVSFSMNLRRWKKLTYIFMIKLQSNSVIKNSMGPLVSVCCNREIVITMKIYVVK